MMIRFVPRRRAPSHAARSLAFFLLAGGLFGIGGTPPTVRAQDSQRLQPFGAVSPSPSPSPTPRRQVRRAQPVTPDNAGASPAASAEPPQARAVPFDSPAPSRRPARDPAASPDETPAWMNRVPSPTPAPATSPASHRYPRPGGDGPVEPTAPSEADNPTPAPAAAQTSTPKATPPRIRPHNPPATDNTGGDAAAGSSPSSAAPPDNGDENTDIRIAPHAPGQPALSPEDQQFNLAGDLYVRKQFAQAAPEYERYLGQFANGKQRQACYWWLGECYRQLKKPVQARSAYQQLVIAYQDGEFVGPACLRLATIDYEAKDYRTALPLFQRAATLAANDAVRLLARYYEAICFEQTGRGDDTRQVYEEILAVTKDNPYRDDAHLALAKLALSQHHPNEAFKEYDALSREGVRPGLQAEASLKAGLLAKELGQTDTALALLTRAASLAGENVTVRSEALLTQLHILYDGNKYKQLLQIYQETHSGLPAAMQPEAMLLAANSQRQTGKHTEARSIYDDIVYLFPRSPQAPEARYQRIISLYAANDPSFVKEADGFLASAGIDPVKTDQVRLMKADTLFKGGDYLGAAQAYAALDGSSNLPAKYKAEAAYRLGFCYAQARKPEQTVAAFTKFLRAHPDSPLAAKALALRAGAFEQLQNYSSALADFTEIINDHKDAKERESALQHKALILGQQKDDRGMTEAFRTLLKEYPKTDAAALAHYQIGRTAYEASKDFVTALAEFQATRASDPKEYGAKASLMIVLCEFQLKDRAKLTEEVAAYQKSKATPEVPPSILLWLGEQEYDDKNYAAAEEHLSAATKTLGKSTAETWLMLARTRVNLEKWDGVLEATSKYLATISPEPRERAVGLLVQGDAQVALRHFDDAQKTVDETLRLQPEGSLNAKARLLGGKLLYAQGKYDEAAKAYRSIAVLYDDRDITPQALARAAEAFDKAGRPDDAKKANDELKTKYPTYTDSRTM